MAARMMIRCMACGCFGDHYPAFQPVPEITVCKTCQKEGKKPRYIWVNRLSKPLLKYNYNNEIYFNKSKWKR